MRIQTVWATAVVVAAWFMMAGNPATVAAQDAYPFADMPCSATPFARQGVRAGWCADYNWGRPSILSPYGYVYRNCTDYAAWRLDELGVAPSAYRGLGDAKQWAAGAAQKGLQVTRLPSVHAVGVKTSGQYGHVAIVEAVHADGSITVSQYNKQGTGVWSEQQGTPQTLGLTAFVDFGVRFVPPVVVSTTSPPTMTMGSVQSAPDLPPFPTVAPLASDPVSPDLATSLDLPAEQSEQPAKAEQAATLQEAPPLPALLAPAVPQPDVVPPPATPVTPPPTVATPPLPPVVNLPSAPLAPSVSAVVLPSVSPPVTAVPPQLPQAAPPFVVSVASRPMAEPARSLPQATVALHSAALVGLLGVLALTELTASITYWRWPHWRLRRTALVLHPA